MALSNPIATSSVGYAQHVRHIYIPATTKSYAIWITSLTGHGFQFVIREIGSADFSDYLIPTTPQNINNFDVFVESGYIIAFLFDDGRYIWKMKFNVSTNTVTEHPNLICGGEYPSLLSDKNSILTSFYLRNLDLKMRKALTGDEANFISPSLFNFRDQDSSLKTDTVNRALLSAKNTINTTVALPLKLDGNTLILYDGEVTAQYLIDQAAGSRDANIYNLHPMSGGGVLFSLDEQPSIPSFPVGSAITIEAWVLPQLIKSISYIIYSANCNLYFTNDGLLRFQYTGVSVNHIFTQTQKSSIIPLEFNHIAFSFTFGTGSSAFFSVNGEPVVASWTTGNGNEGQIFSSMAPSIYLELQNVLGQMRISTIARSQSSILNYIKGII